MFSSTYGTIRIDSSSRIAISFVNLLIVGWNYYQIQCAKFAPFVWYQLNDFWLLILSSIVSKRTNLSQACCSFISLSLPTYLCNFLPWKRKPLFRFLGNNSQTEVHHTNAVNVFIHRVQVASMKELLLILFPCIRSAFGSIFLLLVSLFHHSISTSSTHFMKLKFLNIPHKTY